MSSLKLVISTESGDVVNLEVDSNESVENLKALIEVETAIPLSEQIVEWNQRTLVNNSLSLSQVGIKNNDLLLVRRTSPSSPMDTAPQNPLDAKAFQQYVRNNPSVLQQLLHVLLSNCLSIQSFIQNNPTMAEAVLSDDLTLLSSLLMQQEMSRRAAEAERFQRVNALNSDPLNADAQKQIEEEIRLENVYSNMEQAIEYNPESFGRVVMLYVDCAVNKTPVKAFVDSGAQQTIMSEMCAERCGIMRLVDRRFAGIAKGVGTARIIGRVHLAPIKLGNSFFNCSFTILENQGMDFLLGLDMLKAHQCIIDLKENVLRIGKEAVPFLPESEIPKKELFDEVPPSSSSSLSHPSSKTTSSTTTTTTTSTTPSTTNKPSMSSTATGGFAESTIQQLMGLGFSRDEVVGALRMFNGNAEAAASFLFRM